MPNKVAIYIYIYTLTVELMFTLLLVAAVSLLVKCSLVANRSVMLAVALHDHLKISHCIDVGQFFLVTSVVVATEP